MLFFVFPALLIATAYFLLILFNIRGWLRTDEYFRKKNNFSTQVSIIVPVRNEETHIQQLINDVAGQDFPKNLYELIVVNDGSEDETLQKIFQVREPMSCTIKILNNDPDSPGKKNAVSKGVSEASGGLIVTTDADCSMGRSWLSTIVAYYEENKPDMIIAPVCFHQDETFFHKIQALEFLSLAGIAGASASSGNPVLCNGANLAYTKQAFENVNGFAGNERIASGDDIFLMNKFKKSEKKIRYLKSRDATVRSEPQYTMTDFINQRKRWASKNRFNRDMVTNGSAWIVLLFNFFILLLAGLSVHYRELGEIALYALIMKFLVDFLFLFLSASFFERKSLLWLYIPAQIMYLFYVPLIAMAGISGKFKWKGRIYGSENEKYSAMLCRKRERNP